MPQAGVPLKPSKTQGPSDKLNRAGHSSYGDSSTRRQIGSCSRILSLMPTPKASLEKTGTPGVLSHASKVVPKQQNLSVEIE